MPERFMQHPLGLLTRTSSVVFVHGLGADPTRTWYHGDVCWITDLFPEDLKEKGIQSSVRLFTFNYDSFWVRDSNSTRLTVTAESLSQQLDGDKVGYSVRPRTRITQVTAPRT
jgi:hypothetical protein